MELSNDNRNLMKKIGEMGVQASENKNTETIKIIKAIR